MGDFGFIGMVFLLLVVLREQFLAVLVGSDRNGRFIVAPLNDGDITVRHGKCAHSFLPDWAKEKAGHLFRFPAWVCRYMRVII